MLAAENSKANNDSLSSSNFQSVIITGIKLHSDKCMKIVPLTSLLGSCFSLIKKYCMIHNSQMCTYVKTRYAIVSKKTWDDMSVLTHHE